MSTLFSQIGGENFTPTYFTPCAFKSINLIYAKLKHSQKQPKTATMGGNMLHANNQRAPLAAAKQLLTQTSAPRHSWALTWSKLAVGSPERCPVCVKHIASHGGVLITNTYKPALLKYAPLKKLDPIQKLEMVV